MRYENIQRRMRNLASKEKAKILSGFFKTGPGQYGEGDIFIGITVPILRKLAKECRSTPLADAVRLLKSPIHEERLLALFLLIDFYNNGDKASKSEIYGLYLKHTRHINNWDLVDLSAPNIVGNYLADKSRTILFDMALSRHLWERRIAIVATFYFIRRNDFADALRISKRLLRDEQDLIHKAVGWMLREVGKRDVAIEEKFLLQHYKRMPRTMLRYAIERFPEKRRRMYLDGDA